MQSIIPTMTCADEGFTFIWKIENFSMLPHQEGERLKSPIFIVESLDKTKWHLWFYPKGEPRLKNDKSLSLFLRRCDWETNINTSKISCILALESLNSAFEKSITFKNLVFDIDNKNWGICDFQKLEIVFDNRKLYLPQDVLSIKCHIWPSQDKCNTPEMTMGSSTVSNYFENRCLARTTVHVQKRVLTWPIKKISQLEESGNKISINLANSLEDSPDLKLSFCIDKNLSSEHARLEILQTRSSSEERLFAKCKITVVSADKKHETSYQDTHLFSLNLDEIWHFPDFICIGKIREEYAYVDDTMFLLCEFTFSYKGGEHHLALPMYMPNAFQKAESITESTQLVRKMGGLFAKEEFCDVEVCAGGRTFLCHKLVLCAQSPVFSAMFKNSMKEKETGVVEVTDLDAKTLEKLLNFLYSEVIEDGLPVEDICQLYSAADKYEVLLLQRRCSLLLLSKLSVASVCRVLVSADSHQDHFLWKHAYTFLAIHSREVFHTPEWKSFMVDNPTLSSETMFKICTEESY